MYLTLVTKLALPVDVDLMLLMSHPSPALRDALNTGLSQIAQVVGGSVRSGVGFGTIGQRGSEFFFDPRSGLGNKDYGDPDQYRYATADEATLAALKEAIRDGVITGLSDTARTIAGSSSATTSDNFLADLQFAATYDELTKVGQASSDYADQLKELQDRFIDAGQQARELGLGTRELALAFGRAKRQLSDDFNRQTELAILNFTDPVRAALEQYNDEAKQYLLDAAAVGADLELANRKVRLERQAIIDELSQGTGQALTSFRQSIDDMLRDLQFGSQSGIATRDRLPDLLDRFNSLATAAPTDANARDSLTSAAQEALDAASQVYASSADFYQVQRSIEATLAGLRDLTLDTTNVQSIADQVGAIELDPEFQRVMEDFGREVATGNDAVVAVLGDIRDGINSLKANQAAPVGSVLAENLLAYTRQLRTG